MGRSIAPEHHHPLGGGGVGNGTLAPHGDIGQRKAQPNFSHGSLSKVYLRQKKNPESTVHLQRKGNKVEKGKRDRNIPRRVNCDALLTQAKNSPQGENWGSAVTSRETFQVEDCHTSSAVCRQPRSPVLPRRFPTPE